MNKMYLDTESGTYFWNAPTVIDVTDWTMDDWAAWDNMSDRERSTWGNDYEISQSEHPGPKPLLPADYVKILSE